MTPTAQAGVVFPPKDLTALLDLSRFLEHHTEPALLLGPDGEQVPLPEEVYRVLVEVVEAMREGKVITLVPHTQRLTTQEAADFLGISRPTLVKLLEDGKIPYDQPGRHRQAPVHRPARLPATTAGPPARHPRPDDRGRQRGWHLRRHPRGLRGSAEVSPQASRPPGGRLLICRATRRYLTRAARAHRARRHAPSGGREGPVPPAVVRPHPCRGAGGHRGDPPRHGRGQALHADA